MENNNLTTLYSSNIKERLCFKVNFTSHPRILYAQCFKFWLLISGSVFDKIVDIYRVYIVWNSRSNFKWRCIILLHLPWNYSFIFFLCGLTPNKVKQFRKIYIKNYLFIIIPVSLNSYNCRFNFPGAVHHDDLIYVAYISKLFPFFDETYPEAKMVTKLTTIYANFAKTGWEIINDL